MNEKTKAQRTLSSAQKMRQKKDDNDDDDEDDDDDEEVEEEEEEVRQTSQTERLAALPIELNLNPNLKSKPKLNLGIKYLMNVLLVLGLCLSAQSQLVRSACCLFFEGSSCFCALSRHSFCSCLALSHYSPLILSPFFSFALTALLLKIAEKRERISQI